MVGEIPDAMLVVHGATEDTAACRTALKAWLTDKAKEHLISWLERVSDQTGLSYSSVSISSKRPDGGVVLRDA